jgi:uncharacterized protein involved in outer membrane biogenesis
MAKSRTTRRLVWLGVSVTLILLLVVFSSWDWFIPLSEARASAAIGRRVTIAHLHVQVGRVMQMTADDVAVANPPDWQGDDPPFVMIHGLTIRVDAWGYIQGHGLALPLIDLDGLKILAAETASGAANFRLAMGEQGSNGGSVKIGDVRIHDGEVHAIIPKLKTDVRARIDTQGDGDAAKIVVNAKGTYAAQPLTGKLIGGGLLALRDADHPWPVDMNLSNGPTRVALNGTLRDPVAFQGADVRLRLRGPDMALLEPFVGFPIPKTPAYQISGKLDLNGLTTIRFEDFTGRLGNSDIAGTIEEQPSGTESNGKTKPVVTMDLRSSRVDLADLSGFIGGTPGRTNTVNATAQEREAVARADASPKLLPDTPINIPRLDWADIHLRYHGAHIEGRSVPLDDLAVVMDVVGGRVTLHPISFGIGKGRLSSDIDLTPTSKKNVHAKATLRMQNLDVSRLMAATHTFQGAGSVSGIGALDATGDSLASLMANGNGEVKMAMAGGNVSAVLIDLTGLQFGNALLSALGIPTQTPVQCFVGDLGLTRGNLDFKVMILDTGEAITNVGGDVDLAKETVNLALKTDSKHFSIGSLPTRIKISGTFKDPSIRPGAAVAARAGAAAGLGVLFAPLAILPTVQFGTSDADDARCGALLQQARASAGGKALPAPVQGASPAR